MMEKRPRKMWLGWITAFGLLWTASAQAGVEARIDRTEMISGEPFQLILETRDAAQGQQPDLGVLENDFEILGVTRSFRTTVVNGNRDDVAEWHLTLIPRQLGVLEIPSITFGSERSAPLDISVVDSSSKPSLADQRPVARTVGTDTIPSGPPVTLSARVDESEPFVQEQVIVTLRLESKVPILEGQMGEPQVEGALVERIGQDQQGSGEADGQPINWVERRYAVFPQQSGPITIERVGFEGLTPTTAQPQARRPQRGGLRSRMDALMGSSPFGGSLFNDAFMDDFFGNAFGPRGQTIRASSDPIALAVQPRAGSAQEARWLPAQDLAIVELWGEGQTQPPTLKVGEPVERLVALRARGVTATQLPEPVLGETPGFKQYNAPSQTDVDEENGEIVSIRALPTTLIPTEPGDYELPAVQITWWDTDEDVEKTTTLPARPVTVLPGVEGDLAAGFPPVGAAPTSPRNTPSESAPQPAPEKRDLSWLLAGGLFGFFLISLGGLLWIRRSTSQTEPGWMAQRRSVQQQQKALARACRENNPLDAETALVGLGRALWPDQSVASALDVARLLEEPMLETEVSLLLSARYAAEDKAWNGNSLWTAWRLARRKARVRSRKATFVPLPALHPESS